ncbi:MAG TPA: hypothetical protein VH331_17580 [Allosphingosinicella sp.]|jgi:hypothetical protein|nr:hypothetical protein [Allosphingosinicella sp.]
MKKLILAASLVLGVAVIPAAASAQDYPPCGRDVTDKCMQTREGGGHMMMGDHHHMMRHHHMRHHTHHHHHHKG